MPEFGYIAALVTGVAIAAIISVSATASRPLMQYSYKIHDPDYEKARKLFKKNVGVGPGSRSKIEIDYVNSFY